MSPPPHYFFFDHANRFSIEDIKSTLSPFHLLLVSLSLFVHLGWPHPQDRPLSPPLSLPCIFSPLPSFSTSSVHNPRPWLPSKPKKLPSPSRRMLSPMRRTLNFTKKKKPRTLPSSPSASVNKHSLFLLLILPTSHSPVSNVNPFPIPTQLSPLRMTPASSQSLSVSGSSPPSSALLVPSSSSTTPIVRPQAPSLSSLST